MSTVTVGAGFDVSSMGVKSQNKLVGKSVTITTPDGEQAIQGVVTKVAKSKRNGAVNVLTLQPFTSPVEVDGASAGGAGKKFQVKPHVLSPDR
jgi:hypothetical protein